MKSRHTIAASLRAAVLLTAAVPSVASARSAPPPVWARCAACHSTVAGKPVGLGPDLAGVVGRKAGVAPDFKYSPAMKASGVTWTPAALDAFLAKPQAKVPGTKMMFPGLPDAKDRAAVIHYLQGIR